VREALRLPDFLVRKCGKRSGSRTSWSGSAGSAPAPALPGQEVREALWLPDFLSALRPSHIQLFAKQGEVGRMQAKQASGLVAIGAGFLERPFGDGFNLGS